MIDSPYAPARREFMTADEVAAQVSAEHDIHVECAHAVLRQLAEWQGVDADRLVPMRRPPRRAEPGAVYDHQDRNWPPSLAFLQAYCAWLAAHGIDSNKTRRVEHNDHPAVAQPFIRVYQRDMFSGVAREPFNVPITTPPPKPEDYA